MEITKELIEAYVSDCVKDLLYYNRKECEDLPVESIQSAVKDGILTKEDIVNAFSKELDEWI